MVDYKAVVSELIDWLEESEIRAGVAAFMPDSFNGEARKTPNPLFAGEQYGYTSTLSKLRELIKQNMEGK